MTNSVTKSILIFFALSLTIMSCKSTEHIYIADHLVDCQGEGDQKCMLVKSKMADNWANFYDQIEGFNYEEGYEYLLGVKTTKIKNPPADGSSIKYTLVEVYEKKKVEKPISINNDWQVIAMKDLDLDEIENKPTVKFDGVNHKISGFAGCNNYFGEYKPENKELDFSQMGMTRKMCKDMSIETTFLNNLKNAKMMGIDGKSLVFYDENNDPIINCELIK